MTIKMPGFQSNKCHDRIILKNAFVFLSEKKLYENLYIQIGPI